jgi:hypothetical protein
MAHERKKGAVEDSEATVQCYQRLHRTLPSAVTQQLAFLDKVNTIANLLSDPLVLRLAVARYKYLWLPLCTKHRSHPDALPPLNPALDIAFIYHCHLLRPIRCDCPAQPDVYIKRVRQITFA